MIQRRLLTLALVFSILSAAIAVAVPRVTDGPTFSFMLWNLVLAWIPMVAALALHDARRVSFAVQLPLLAVWLAFFPNAPYLVTDLIHVRTDAGPLSLARDATLFSLAAVAGLILGFVSLALVERTLHRRFGPRAALAASLVFIAAASVGVYLGRVVRLNSWDLLMEPRVVAGAVRDRLLAFEGDPVPLLATVVTAAALTATYLVFRRAAHVVPERGRRRLTG